MKQWEWAVALLLAGCAGPDQTPVTAANDSEAAVPANDAEPSALGEAANAETVSACLVQDGERIAENAIRAIGTEPFWGADVQGRCVTYSTPEDQDGTRIWTKFSGSAENGRWTGALDGRPFVMVTREQEGCSDGMSDNLYPIAVMLTVRGELRTGCAISKAEWEKRKPA